MTAKRWSDLKFNQKSIMSGRSEPINEYIALLESISVVRFPEWSGLLSSCDKIGTISTMLIMRRGSGKGETGLESFAALFYLLSLPVGIIPELVAFFFLPLVISNPAPFDQSSQGPDQLSLCPDPVHIEEISSPIAWAISLMDLASSCNPEEPPELPHGSWYASPICLMQVKSLPEHH